MKSFKFKDLMVNVAPSAERAVFCAATCRFGTGCGFFTPCGFTCDFGNTHLTRPVFQEQARAAAPAAQAGVAAGAQLCAVPTVHCTLLTGATCPQHTCFGCTLYITEICRIGPTFIACNEATCAPSFQFTPTIQVDPEGVSNQLAAVKAQLQQELAAIETQEKAVAEALRPQTADEVEELQGKLRDAIAELDKQKQELQKKSDKPSKK